MSSSRADSSRSILGRFIVALALGSTFVARTAHAQRPPPPQPIWCLPGTTICFGGNGNGNAGASGSANGQLGPNGASGNATGNGQGMGNANGGAAAAPPPPPPTPPVMTPPSPSPSPPVMTPPSPSPPVMTPPPEPSNTHGVAHGGPWGAGFSICGVARAGFWSGYHYGGCLAIPLRKRYYGVDFIETQVTSGGTLPMFDIIVSPTSLLLPLWSDDTLWNRAYLRIGMQFGFSFPESDAGHQLFRIGGHAGFGYELNLSSSIALRVLDARFVGEATGYEVDRLDQRFDFGVLLSSGVIFK